MAVTSLAFDAATISEDLAQAGLKAPTTSRKPGIALTSGTAAGRNDVTPVGSPYEGIVSTLMEGSRADVGWLAWRDAIAAAVVLRPDTSPLPASTIAEFPEPPRQPLIVGGRSRDSAWALWCQARGILSCLVVPVRQGSQIVGTIGLASSSRDAIGAADIERLEFGAALAIQARRHETRLASLRRLFDEVSRTLENALALDRALRMAPTYREIARLVGESLDATYCQIATIDGEQALLVRAAGGHRPPNKVGTTWPLRRLRRCAEALQQRRAVVLTFSRHDLASEPERRALFSPTTRAGVLLPFFAGPRTRGVLILGEERATRCQPLSPERVAILALVASRIGHIMRIARRLEYDRMGGRRRQRQLTVERQRLARDLHDEIGQALSALLVQIRCSAAEGNAGPQALQLLEQTASAALTGARALAYGFRHLERGVTPLEEARAFSETMLRGAKCRLSWIEERTDQRVATRTLREIGHAIKEAVSNIVRHANANCVRIRVEYPDERIRVTVQDNGIGFSVGEARPTSDGRGLGLIGASERLARVGGVFDVISAPRQGALVIMEAPRQ